MTGWSSVLIPVFSALLGSVVGGYVVHHLAARRELLGERRAVRVKYLVDAWRAIMAVTNRTEKTPCTELQGEAFENALTDVMLLGEAAETKAIEAYIGAVGRGDGTNLNGVVHALRDSLRQELKLSRVPLPKDRVLRLDWSQSSDAGEQ